LIVPSSYFGLLRKFIKDLLRRETIVLEILKVQAFFFHESKRFSKELPKTQCYLLLDIPIPPRDFL